jgi:aryl-alcohol dehydrogenase-like predicted oxidoreductase
MKYRQLHWPDSTTPVAETMEALTQLLRQGKIRAAGVSNYSADLMAEAEKTLCLASNQVPYSMVERSIEKELVPYCLKYNKAIIAYSPMQRGLLTGKIKPDHVFAPGDDRPNTVFFQPENIRRIDNFLDRLEPLAQSRNADISQLVLRWTVEQPGITIALAGARNKQQAIQNVKAAHLALTAEEIKFVDGELKKLKLVDERVNA